MPGKKCQEDLYTENNAWAGLWSVKCIWLFTSNKGESNPGKEMSTIKGGSAWKDGWNAIILKGQRGTWEEE